VFEFNFDRSDVEVFTLRLCRLCRRCRENSPVHNWMFGSDMSMDLAATQFNAAFDAAPSPFADNATNQQGLQGVASQPQAITITINYTCERTFTLLDSFTLFARDNASAPFESLDFGWQKACLKPGCDVKCAVHGVCDEVIGLCVCNSGYYGTNCEVCDRARVASLWGHNVVRCVQMKAALEQTAVCPGTNLTMSFVIPPRALADLDWCGVWVCVRA
jgi:hypothetical protein